MSRLSRFQNTAEMSGISLRFDRLLLDDGGQRQHLVHVEIAGARLRENLGRDLLAHPCHHAGEDLLRGHALHELVGVGKEIALDRAPPGCRASLRKTGSRADPKDVLGAGEPLGLEQPGELGQRASPPRKTTGAGGPGRPRSGSSTASVLEPCGIWYSPALRLRKLPRARARSMKPSGLLMTPASSRLSATSSEALVGRDLHDAGPAPRRRARREDPAGLEHQERTATQRQRSRAAAGSAAGPRWPGSPHVLRIRGRSIMFAFILPGLSELSQPRTALGRRGLAVPDRLSGILHGLGRPAPDLPGGIPCSSWCFQSVTNGSPGSVRTARSRSSPSSRASPSRWAMPTAGCSCPRSRARRPRGSRSRACSTSSRTCRV